GKISCGPTYRRSELSQEMHDHVVKDSQRDRLPRISNSTQLPHPGNECDDAEHGSRLASLQPESHGQKEGRHEHSVRKRDNGQDAEQRAAGHCPTRFSPRIVRETDEGADCRCECKNHRYLEYPDRVLEAEWIEYENCGDGPDGEN